MVFVDRQKSAAWLGVPCRVQSAKIDQFLAEEPNLMHACKDVNMTITTESVTVVDMDDCNVRSFDDDDDDDGVDYSVQHTALMTFRVKLVTCCPLWWWLAYW